MKMGRLLDLVKGVFSFKPNPLDGYECGWFDQLGNQQSENPHREGSASYLQWQQEWARGWNEASETQW